MDQGLDTLSDRERETLRLLLAGHDAKSTALRLGLSVHTVNERLRDARRKLNVTSSREAARMLGSAEQGLSNSLVDERFGVATPAAAAEMDPPLRRQETGSSVFWLSGGMLLMSLIIAAAALSFAFRGAAPHDSAPPAAVPPAAVTVDAPQAQAAGAWVALLDSGRWEASWQQAARLFQSQITATQWESSIRSVRVPLGAVASRTLQSTTKAGTLPGAPAGEYEVLQYWTRFAGKPEATETVILTRESGVWKVAGYFIR